LAGSLGSTLADNVRVFDIAASADAVTLRGLTVTGGYTSGNTSFGSIPLATTYQGGGIRTAADLTLVGMRIEGNSTTGTYSQGGGIAFGPGDHSIQNSTIRDNLAQNAGGGGF